MENNKNLPHKSVEHVFINLNTYLHKMGLVHHVEYFKKSYNEIAHDVMKFSKNNGSAKQYFRPCPNIHRENVSHLVNMFSILNEGNIRNVCFEQRGNIHGILITFFDINEQIPENKTEDVVSKRPVIEAEKSDFVGSCILGIDRIKDKTSFENEIKYPTIDSIEELFQIFGNTLNENEFYISSSIRENLETIRVLFNLMNKQIIDFNTTLKNKGAFSHSIKGYRTTPIMRRTIESMVNLNHSNTVIVYLTRSKFGSIDIRVRLN